MTHEMLSKFKSNSAHVRRLNLPSAGVYDRHSQTCLLTHGLTWSVFPMAINSESLTISNVTKITRTDVEL